MKRYHSKRSSGKHSIERRLRERASRLYPALEFYWDAESKTFSVLGGKPIDTTYPKNPFTKAIKRGQIDYSLREQLKQFRKDPYFDKFRGNSEDFWNPPPPPPLPPATALEKPSSAWPLPGASASASVPQLEPPPIIPALVFKDKPKAIIMPQRGRRRKIPQRRRRIQNPALRAARRPFKQVVPVDLASGYFDYEFNINALIPELLTVYEEVRITSLSVVFLVKDVTVGSGLYTAILLDQNGYGTALKSTATWFKRVADMPGSLVHHATRGFRLSWRPTEPDGKNFIKVIDTEDLKKTIARVYIIGQDKSLSMGGVLLIRGRCLCRGQYYDATKFALVKKFAALRAAEIEKGEDEDPEELVQQLTSCSYPPSEVSAAEEVIQ